MAELMTRAKSALSEEWLLVIHDLGQASLLFQEATATSSPQVHIQHPVLRFTPSTVKRYLADWRSWTAFCATLSASPSDPPPGVLPDWLASRASKQGLATGPLRARPGLPARPACPPCKLACSCRLSVPLPPPQHRPKGAKVCPFLCHLSYGWSAVWRICPHLRPNPSF